MCVCVCVCGGRQAELGGQMRVAGACVWVVRVLYSYTTHHFCPQFPLCDGSHNAHNECCKDNVGPLIVKGGKKA